MRVCGRRPGPGRGRPQASSAGSHHPGAGESTARALAANNNGRRPQRLAGLGRRRRGDPRDRGQQRPRVCRLRIAEHGGCAAGLLDAAFLHHDEVVGDVLDDADVVRDEQIRDAELALQLEQQVQDLRLHRDVECRGRLIADDELGLDRERARDRDALALAARELVRIALERVAAQPLKVSL